MHRRRGDGTMLCASPGELFGAVDIVFLEETTSERFRLASEAIAKATHVFLGWPPSMNRKEQEKLADLAEEAGVEVGVSRPLPISCILAGLPEAWQPDVLSVLVSGSSYSGEHTGPVSSIPWEHRLAGVIHLCYELVGSKDVQSVDAEVARVSSGRISTTAFTLRFRNGTFAQCLVRERDRITEPNDRFELDAAGSSRSLCARSLEGPLCIEQFQNMERTSHSDETARVKSSLQTLNQSEQHLETIAFLKAIYKNVPAPFAIQDALQVSTSVERLLARIR